MPWDVKDAVARWLPAVGFLNLAQPDDKLLRLDFDPLDMGVHETSVVDQLCWPEMAANCAYDH